MRIAYILQSRFPTEKAYGYQVAQVCHAMAELGHTVTLICPTTAHTIHESAFAHYAIPETFTVEYLPSFDALQSRWVPGKFAFFASMLSYGRSLRKHLREQSFDLLYTRSSVLLPALFPSKLPVILELHTLPRIARKAFVGDCNRCARVVCLTSLQKKELLHWGVRENRMTVEPDGVDLARFARLPDAMTARERWNLPSQQPIIGYCGSLVTQDRLGKGVDVLVRALGILKDRHDPCFGWIIGGPKQAVEQERQLAESLGLALENIRFHGPMRASDVPSALAACDVLVYPAPSSAHPYYLRDTSPLKLFEYGAAGRPVICADIPPVHDIINGEMAFLCPPGNPRALADQIALALSDHAMAERKALALRTKIANYSWVPRMKRIVDSVTL